MEWNIRQKCLARERKTDSWTSRNCQREIEGSAPSSLGRTALLWRQVSLKDHRQPTRGTKDFRSRWCVLGWRRGRLLFSRIMRLRAKAALQGSQLAPNGSAKETVIADLHKSVRQDVLEEALKKLLDRQRTLFELPGIGSAVLKGDLRTFHTAAIVKGKQAPIADGDPMDIGSQILERGLTITNRLAMHNPLLCPDLGGDFLKEFHFL